MGTINPGGVKTEFAIGKGRTETGVAQSNMLEADDVAAAILFACTQPKGSRIMGTPDKAWDDRRTDQRPLPFPHAS